jgi:hypothetical protein
MAGEAVGPMFVDAAGGCGGPPEGRRASLECPTEGAGAS